MPQLPTDTRGILAPVQMLQRVALDRYPVPEPLVGLVDWFWSVRWDLPDGETHEQWVVPQPGVNVSVGVAPPPGANPPPGPFPPTMKINGVTTTRSCRSLRGSGWNLAAKTTTGGFGAWMDDVATITDQVVDAQEVGLDAESVANRCANVAATLPEGAEVLSNALIVALERRPQARIAQAREVATIAAQIEADRGLRRVEQVADLAGVTARTLQRQFASCAGVGPAFVIRRYRLLEAAERVREGTPVDWAEVAADLGYADQAHLTRDFTATVGQSPAAYARSCKPSSGRP